MHQGTDGHFAVSFPGRLLQNAPMRPADLQLIGTELAIKWPDGRESFIPLETLRRACPCAGCMGEADIMGHLHKGPDAVLTERSCQMTRFTQVGGYGIQPVWADG